MHKKLYDYLEANLLNILSERIEKDIKGNTCYKRNDKSGRDYYDLIPLDFINEDEKELILDDIFDDLIYEFGENNNNTEFDINEIYDDEDEVFDLIKNVFEKENKN